MKMQQKMVQENVGTSVFNGKQATGLSIPSFKYNDCVIVLEADDRGYRLNKSDLLSIIQEFTFKIEQKKVYPHLTNPKHIGLYKVKR